jgi:tetratricopeptide (TPR) repeat protein
LIHAGDNATALYANAEAAEHYTRALSLADKLPEEAQLKQRELYVKRGATINMALSRFDESIDDYRKMLKQQEGFTHRKTRRWAYCLSNDPVFRPSP